LVAEDQVVQRENKVVAVVVVVVELFTLQHIL
jgi:hypothetical protein